MSQPNLSEYAMKKESEASFGFRLVANGTVAQVAIQCDCPDTGETGTFLFVAESHRNKGTRVSPVCADMYELAQWTVKSGWKGVCGSYVYGW